MRGAPLCQAIWCCSFLGICQGKWEVTEKWHRSGSSEDHDSRFTLYCSVHCERASGTVQVIGKFCSLHNPQKLLMRQISYKNYILQYLIFRKIIYLTLTQTW